MGLNIGPEGPSIRSASIREVVAPDPQLATEGLSRSLGVSVETLSALPEREQAALHHLEASVDAAFRRVYGAGAEAARAHVDAAAQAEGPSAYARLSSDPSAFGQVVSATDARVLGGGLTGRAQMADYLNARQSPAVTLPASEAVGERDTQRSPDPEVDRIVAFVQERLSRHPERGDLAVTVRDLNEGSVQNFV